MTEYILYYIINYITLSHWVGKLRNHQPGDNELDQTSLEDRTQDTSSSKDRFPLPSASTWLKTLNLSSPPTELSFGDWSIPRNNMFKIFRQLVAA